MEVTDYNLAWSKFDNFGLANFFNFKLGDI